jgi:hypothetical protein
MGPIVLALLLTATATAQNPNDDPKLAGRTVVFSVDLPLDVPGAVLQPGTYVLRVTREPGNTGDLAQLQLWDAAETSVIAELYAVHAYAGSPENSIMTYYEGTSGRRILKAWNLLRPNYTLRIVYPPAQAAELARITSQTVFSMPLPGAPAVAAAPQAPATPPSTLEASPEDPAPPAPALPAAFPKTAGKLPLILWLGFTALAAFLVMRMYRADRSLAQNGRNNAVARRAAAAAYRTYQMARVAAGKQA